MKLYKMLVREFLAEYTKALRTGRDLTQEKMAEQLHITSRAYGDLERGRYCFSAITLLFLLLMLEDWEIKELLDRFRKRVYTLEHADFAGTK